ncbi:MAG: hypothetical protein VX320_02610 [Candidatus Thermoplasmatota archaeon]|nr:hypothetical protein [Candidatus Thermoplasmatota archaeon]MEE3082967.1 hypothetical protein [Candidatus Thermoplasmatota archaeon]
MVQDDDEELVVSLPVMEGTSRSSTDKIKDFFGAIRVIWYELTAGVGAWGSLKPLLAAGLAAIPFLFFGQHFNRQHQKGFDWTLLQIPLLLTIVLWPILWVWSIVDAYRVAMLDVTENENQKRVMAALD